jgi:trehalose 6-phosphate phosphatase
MRYLFSSAGHAAIDDAVAGKSLIGLDFDGTLSPIVPLPENAYVTQSVTRSLNALIGVAKVAIISGRSIDDMLRRIPSRPCYLLGNHGMEGLPGTQELCMHARNLTGAWVRQLREAEACEPVRSGVVIEDKGCSMALHYRLSADRADARRRIEQWLALLSPQPRLIHGHCVINLLHPEAPDKGKAFGTLLALSGCKRAVYIGDDETDELVFRTAPDNWLTVRVGYAMDSAAHYFLQQQAEVGMLLEKMASRLRVA